MKPKPYDLRDVDGIPLCLSCNEPCTGQNQTQGWAHESQCKYATYNYTPLVKSGRMPYSNEPNH